MNTKDHTPEFLEFHTENPHVYTELVKLARQAKERDRSKIGMKMLFEVLRWNRMITTNNTDFKLNNNYTSHYARKIMEDYKELQGLFETREHREITP
jgi:hypothetical protein